MSGTLEMMGRSPFDWHCWTPMQVWKAFTWDGTMANPPKYYGKDHYKCDVCGFSPTERMNRRGKTFHDGKLIHPVKHRWYQ